jgi:hypothetical protein
MLWWTPVGTAGRSRAPERVAHGEMTMTETTTTPAGWFPDPWSGDHLRWWDGTAWTGHVADRYPPKPPSGWTRFPLMLALLAVPVVADYATIAALFVLIGPIVFEWRGFDATINLLGLGFVLVWFAVMARRVDYRSRDTFFSLIPFYNWVFQVRTAWRYAALPARPWPTGFEPWARHDQAEPSGPARDVVAVWAFIAGVAGAFVLPALAAVVLGLVGLRRVGRRSVRGRAFALTGLVAGLLWILLYVAIIVRFLATPTLEIAALADATVPAGVTRVYSDSSATVGDCLPRFAGGGGTVHVVPIPCGSPHKAQIFAMFQLPPGPFASPAEFEDVGNQACASVVRQVLSDGAIHDSSLSLGYIVPTARLWRSGDHVVDCLVYSDSMMYDSAMR